MQGRRHEVLFGDRIHGHSKPPTPKLILSSDFGHFILKMLDYSKKLYVNPEISSAAKFCLGGWIHGHRNQPTPEIHFLLEFRPLYF